MKPTLVYAFPDIKTGLSMASLHHVLHYEFRGDYITWLYRDIK